MNILEKWNITPDQLTELLDENPSLRGILFGYVAEVKLKEIVATIPDVSYLIKFDDHDRKKKGDLSIVYKGRTFTLESKSLQSAMIKWNDQNNCWQGRVQVDASDRRNVQLPDGQV